MRSVTVGVVTVVGGLFLGAAIAAVLFHLVGDIADESGVEHG